MKLRRSLLLTSLPVAAGLAVAGPALAGSSSAPVTVRVEGAARTLLTTTTVTAPASGSITKDGAPKGTCPADSAAGALNAATHGRWAGKYDSGIGLFVTRILSTTLSNDKVAYWDFFVNDRPATTGICDTKLHRGESLLFAEVSAKGAAPLPIVVSAPRKVRAGREFALRTFEYTGTGDATRPVRGVKLTVVAHRGAAARLGMTSETRAGVTYVKASAAGTLTIQASAKGVIRSAPVHITVGR